MFLPSFLIGVPILTFFSRFFALRFRKNVEILLALEALSLFLLADSSFKLKSEMIGEHLTKNNSPLSCTESSHSGMELYKETRLHRNQST